MGGGDSMQTLASIAGNGKDRAENAHRIETLSLTILVVCQCWSGTISVRIV